MTYGILIQLCVLALLAKGMDTFRWKIYWPAFFAVTIPMAISSATNAISGYGAWPLISASSYVLLFAQFVAALVVFNFLKVYEDTIALWLMILLSGGLLIYIITPALVGVIF